VGGGLIRRPPVPLFNPEIAMSPSDTPRILIIDDDEMLLEVTSHALEDEGYEVLTAQSSQSGLRKVFQDRPHLVILDIVLPNDIDGFEICKRIREMTDVPIVMLTSRDDEDDIVRGLELGADDYIVKPFKPRELRARVKAALRRTNFPLAEDQTLVYEDPWLSIDIPRRQIMVDGQSIRLSATEFDLLALLLKHADHVLDSETILREVWGPEYSTEIAYVRVYISHLRQKIERDASNPEYILTERQIGYRFIPRE